MPNFPEHRGELPERLHWLNLAHYSRLAYWVYFRPHSLHCYLYQASPEVYQLRGYRKLLQSWKLPSYRNVYLMLPVAIALFSLFVALAVVLYALGTVQGNTAWVNALAVTPNGQIAVSAAGDRAIKVKVPSADSTLKVWNLRWGSELHTLRGHRSGVTAVAVTPDGKQAVSASRDRTLKVWDIQKGSELHDLRGHQDWVTSIVLTPDGKRGVSTGADRTLRVWDLQTGKELQTLEGHNDIVWAVALTPDGQRAVSASGDRTLKVWDVQTGKELYTLTGHNAWVTGVAVTPDGQQAISASVDQTLKVWDLQTGRELQTLRGHQGWVKGVVITPDGQRIVSASADGTLKIWDLQTGKALHTLTGHQGWVTSVALWGDGQKVVSASTDQTVRTWDVQTGKALHTLTGHHAWVTAIAVLPNTPRILSASFDRYPKLWNLNRGTELTMSGVVTQSVGLDVGFTTAWVLAAIFAALSVALVLAIAMMLFGVAGSIVASLLFTFVGSLVFCFAYLVVDRIASDPLLKGAYNAVNIGTGLIVIFGIVLGIVIGVAFGLVNRKTLGVFASIVFIGVIGIAVAIVVASVVTPSISFKGRLLPGIRAGIAVSITFNLLVALGALRLPFYPIEFLMALYGRFNRGWHPALWDELLVLPVPGTGRFLRSHLRASEPEGLASVAAVARNPFQRGYAQHALSTYLHSQPDPLQALYRLLNHPALNTYAVAPISQPDWQLLPTTRQLFLGELAHRWVDCSSDGTNQLTEGVVWNVTKFSRKRQQTPLTRLAGMLYELSYIKAQDINLSSYEKVYGSLAPYPGSQEIDASFAALSDFLTYNELGDLKKAAIAISKLTTDQTAIRPTVLTASDRLGKIAALVTSPQPNSVEQLATFARATRRLDVLDDYVVEQVAMPEQSILRRIVYQWRQLISKAAGERESI
ncbi:MAG: hypothetical protein KME06_08925 [Kastovskya adunca ATA6-11-RM4]|jgi:WD40 repeat protein|nr:hypothetical protein [Kastovskya adunca ATA6-11-RM4]